LYGVNPVTTREHQRIYTPHDGTVHPWRRWGPYVAERAWGTVREDYSADGAAWDYFPHELARSKAYRWGEDGLAAVCDRYQLLVFALALWNGRDSILKERLFGLGGNEGNHGEDVKECYYYLDSTPTHSYMRYLYKYPHAEFPYAELVEENRRRSAAEPEYELLDTGVFDEDRYFDVFVEYAKAGPDDLCIRIEAINRGPEAAPLHILPHLWFRNRWSWVPEPLPRPIVATGPSGAGYTSLVADDTPAMPLANLPFEYHLGPFFLYAEAGGRALFTNNDTNAERLWGMPGATPYAKDAFHRHVIGGEDCTNPERVGTKACLHYAGLLVPPGGSAVVRLRLTNTMLEDPLGDVDDVVELRRAEADAFYDSVHPPKATEDERLVQRQALAGMLWSKQVYLFDVQLWLDGDNPGFPPPASRVRGRNSKWRHLNSMRVLSVPDKWEFPWFAAWDLAFHAVALAVADPELAKEQLWLLLFEQFQHPNGQIPACEWEFSLINPPVHAWAVLRVYEADRARTGRADRAFLERCFHKLLINFAWWVNKVDRDGNNVFEGGFLGLDNITVIDRSKALPDGTVLEQSDATGWMGMFCLDLMRIALELAKENDTYEALATKFFQHFIYIAAATRQMGGRQYDLWDDRDGFFYDVLRYADGSFHKFRLRSLVGLVPLFAVARLDVAGLEAFPAFRSNLDWFLENRRDLVRTCVTTVERDGERAHVLTMVDERQLRRLLERVWDPAEFRSEYGLRSLSKYHEAHPFDFGGEVVAYEPAEAATSVEGGNSNWRGPVWLPMTFLMIDALRRLAEAHGDSLEITAGRSGEPPATFGAMAHGFAERMVRIFALGPDGGRPVHGRWTVREHNHWRDLVLFHEYFHAETGAGLGASHQTGWSGLVASILDEWRR
jgi:hypothetical protein